jgi:hypothetical protein
MSMFALMFSGYDLLALDNLPMGFKMNNQFVCVVVLEEIRQIVMTCTEKRKLKCNDPYERL